MSSHAQTSGLLTAVDLRAMKQRGEKISCLTAYDASFSSLIDQAGVDVMLVGDSLGMVIQGHATTLPVTVADMLYHCRIVTAARKRSLVIVDLPFASYATPKQSLANAASLVQLAGAQMIKLEGAKIDIIQFLVAQGISICGHLGLLPQSVNLLGGYKTQGRDAEQAQQILADALRIEDAGADCLVLECIPAALAAEISQRLSIPTIGIGAGVACDGQVLVLYDMLGIGKQPRFSKNFMQDAVGIADAILNYHQAVKTLSFPGPAQSY